MEAAGSEGHQAEKTSKRRHKNDERCGKCTFDGTLWELKAKGMTWSPGKSSCATHVSATKTKGKLMAHIIQRQVWHQWLLCDLNSWKCFTNKGFPRFSTHSYGQPAPFSSLHLFILLEYEMTKGKAPCAQEQPQLVNNIFVHGYSVKHRELLVGDNLNNLKVTQ